MGACCESEGLPQSGEYVLVDQPKANIYRQEKMVTNLAPVCIKGVDIKELPHSSIVALRIKDPLTKNRFFYGSGALISHNLVLTAAHNIYDKLYSRQFQKEDYQIYQGVDGVAEQFHEVEDWRYLEQFKTCSVNNKLQYDYALIKLKPNTRKPIPHTKFLDLGLPCGCILKKDVHMKLEVYGYPQYRQNYEPQNKQLTKLTLFQYGLTVPDSILEVDPSCCKITYAANTLCGQSGCPVVVNNQIIAIHIGSGTDEGNQNMGRLVTADLIRNIAAWKQQLKGDSFNFLRGTCTHKKQALPEQRKDPNLTKAEKLQATAERLKANYRYDAALQSYTFSLAIYEEIKGKDSVEVANILVNGIGDIKDEQGRYSQALMAYERGLAIYQNKEGEESHGVASALQRIGAVYHLRGEYALALENYRKALVICQNIYGSNSFEAAYTINNVGLVYRDQGEYTLALGRLFKSLAIYQKSQKANSVEVAFAHNNIGSVYYSKRQWEEALQHFSQALNIYQSIKGRGSVEAASTLMNIGLVYDGQGDSLLAIEMYQRCIGIYEKHSLRHRAYANAHADLATSYRRIRDYKSAAVAYGVSLSIYEQIGLAANLKKNSLGLVRSLRKLGETAEAKKIMEKYGLPQSQI